MTWPRQLFKCLKLDCLRKVPEGVAYCCGPCAAADVGRYEIHAHTATCEQTAAERGGDWPWAEAQAHLQPGDAP